MRKTILFLVLVVAIVTTDAVANACKQNNSGSIQDITGGITSAQYIYNPSDVYLAKGVDGTPQKAGFSFDISNQFVSQSLITGAALTVWFQQLGQSSSGKKDVSLSLKDDNGNKVQFTSPSIFKIGSLFQYTYDVSDYLNPSNGPLLFSLKAKTGPIMFLSAALNVTGNKEAPTSPVPLPASSLLFGSGIVALMSFRHVSKRKLFA